VIKALFVRNGRTINDLTTGKATGYATNNQAKRASAKLQKENGGLGRGALRVNKK
jgi:hypothetical protein